ncbi:DUF3231 family protein [Desulfosporosinus youngiae]|uniref:DUF3231 family protein n=1 Tax=Desulfosporosinus youngiae DSM 17734 TaxID=768710 RepID=H5Y2V4_9FIRM|nr:DUF3231 family protein [Desulfosporosinus youngiae]EHQ88511.1 Protein of unknown function (DUF3231) [Desulfosporosinus youngiae DSM 17734]
MNNLDQRNNGMTAEQVPLGYIQHNLTDIKPMASEIAHLWSSYLAENMSVCMLKYMVSKSNDIDIHNVLQLALDISSKRVRSMKDIYNSIHNPIPDGFSEKDVKVDVKGLFSDSFSLTYTRLMTKFIMQYYCISLSESARTDFRDFFSEAINTSQEVMVRATDVLLAKGLLNKSPCIEIPDKVSYVHEKNYYGSFFRGSDRPLNVIEVDNIYYIMELKIAMKTLKSGFSQVVESEKLRNYLIQGLNIADNQLKILGTFLEKENLPIPEDTNYQVTKSQESPFSDKLMMFHVTVTMAYVLTAYGYSLTNTSRKDLVTSLSRLIAEILDYCKDGMDLMIENGWLERVPEATNREKLQSPIH